MNATVDREAWLAERRRGVGGSDVHHLWGLPPYGCRRRIWYDKSGAAPDHPDAPTPHMLRGTALEPVVADMVAQTTGRKLRRAGLRWHRTEPHLLVNLDREICRRPGDATPGLLEVKCPGVRTYQAVRRDGLPDSWQLQVQHALLVTGYRWGLVAVLSAELWDLTLVPVEPDAELQARIREEVPRFWRLIENGPIPDRLETPDARCRSCPWRATCLGPLAATLAPAAPEAEPGEELPADPALGPLVQEYLQMRGLQDEAEELAREAGDRLRAALGERQAVATEGARVYYRGSRRTTYDTKALKADHPDIAAKYERTTSVRSLRVYPT